MDGNDLNELENKLGGIEVYLKRIAEALEGIESKMKK